MSFAPTHLRPESGIAFSLFPSNLRFLRKKRGLNQEDISMLFNKRANTVGNWENGKTEPSIPELLVISGYFGVNLEDLLRSEMRQKQVDMETQLSLWPDTIEKLAGFSQATAPKDPARTLPAIPPPESVHIAAPAWPADKVRSSELLRPEAQVRIRETERPLGATYINETNPEPGKIVSALENNVDEHTAAPEALPAGDAIWFVLRELRSVQERLDRMQSAFDQSRVCRPADKSDH